MMRVCHLNTCPVGIATQDPELRKNFNGKAEHVVNFFRFIAQEVREYMAALGFRTMDEMVGRVDRLNFRQAIDHWKAKGLDYSAILHMPKLPEGTPLRKVKAQDHGLDEILDQQLIAACTDALENGAKVSLELPIRNVNRTTGTMLGSRLTRKWGGKGLPDDTIQLKFNGQAGQSFGAFVPRGMTLTLEGDANDYVGKGLSGGKLIVYPPKNATFVAEDNIVIGNVALYGATSGEAYFRGVAGERFGVRNSGAVAVVEGVGDHACEYMTGGRVVVLGRTGRNFAAGMSGGIAYVLDSAGTFQQRCNMAMVELDPLDDPADILFVQSVIETHVAHTGSELGARVLRDFDALKDVFVKVMPRDFKRVLNAQAKAAAAGREATFLELTGAS